MFYKLMRKFGIFEIHVKTLHDSNSLLLLRAIADKVIILESEQSFVEYKIRYKAYCEDFKEIKEGETLPLYKIQVIPIIKTDQTTNREKPVRYEIKFVEI